MSTTHKSFFGVGVLVCLVLVMLTGWSLGAWRGAEHAATAAASLEAKKGPGRYGQEGLRVSGTAVVRSAPELAIVQLGYESRARKARQAKLENDEVMAKIIAALEKSGVKRADIQTVKYRVFPVWEKYPNPSTRTLFWHVLNMVEVRVRDVESVAEVIDEASAAGADKVDSVKFVVEKIHELRIQAREEAMRIAKEKAEQLAQLSGARLGRVVAVNDNTSYWYGGRAQSTSNSILTFESPSATQADIESVLLGGQIEVWAREELVFALE